MLLDLAGAANVVGAGYFSALCVLVVVLLAGEADFAQGPEAAPEGMLRELLVRPRTLLLRHPVQSLGDALLEVHELADGLLHALLELDNF